MSKEEISVDIMRFLFSLLDTDGGSSLSPEEIKKGMLLLGFEEDGQGEAAGGRGVGEGVLRQGSRQEGRRA